MLFKTTRQIGNKAEDFACQYLQKLGYKIIQRNFQVKGGEIDIIAKYDNQLIFIEVKARYSHNYGLPQEAITFYKIKALQRTALYYTLKVGWGNRPYRFDLLAIDYSQSAQNPQIELIKNFTS